MKRTQDSIRIHRSSYVKVIRGNTENVLAKNREQSSQSSLYYSLVVSCLATAIFFFFVHSHTNVKRKMGKVEQGWTEGKQKDLFLCEAELSAFSWNTNRYIKQESNISMYIHDMLIRRATATHSGSNCLLYVLLCYEVFKVQKKKVHLLKQWELSSQFILSPDWLGYFITFPSVHISRDKQHIFIHQADTIITGVFYWLSEI